MVPARALRNVMAHDMVLFGAPASSVWNDDDGRRPSGTRPAAPMMSMASSVSTRWYSLQ